MSYQFGKIQRINLRESKPNKEKEINKDIPNFKIWKNKGDGQIRVYDYYKNSFETMDMPPTGVNSFYLPKSYDLKPPKNNKDDPKEYIKLMVEEYDDKIKYKMIEYAEILRKEVIEISTLYHDGKTKYHKKGERVFKMDYFDNTYKFKSNGKIFYRTHTSNIKTFLKFYCKDLIDKTKYKFDIFDNVSLNEYIWFKKCNNGGLIYLKEKGRYDNCFGYDYKMNYPTNMASIGFQIPTKEGKEIYFKELPTNLKYGIYNCVIKSTDENFNKIFNFSGDNHYTHYSLNFAIKLKKDLEKKQNKLIDVDISICTNSTKIPNALVYDKENLISGCELFGCWYYTLKELKEKLPKNGIVKLLSSSAWGHINQVSAEYYTLEEKNDLIKQGKKFGYDMKNKNLDYVILNISDLNNRIRYKVLDAKKPVYKIPIRLLPFITSYSRTKIAEMILRYDLFDDLIRIQTDSIILSKKFEVLEEYLSNDIKIPEKIKNLIPDEKISGNIEFIHINKYKKIGDGVLNEETQEFELILEDDDENFECEWDDGNNDE